MRDLVVLAIGCVSVEATRCSCTWEFGHLNINMHL